MTVDSEPSGFLPQYLEGLRLFNEGQYWHAHEAWEEIWMEADGVERDFYQGLIQVAAACFQIRRANWSGAGKLLHSATANLLPAAPRFGSLDVALLLERVDRMIEEVGAAARGARDGFDPSLLPRLALDAAPSADG